MQQNNYFLFSLCPNTQSAQAEAGRSLQIRRYVSYSRAYSTYVMLLVHPPFLMGLIRGLLAPHPPSHELSCVLVRRVLFYQTQDT